MEILARGRAAGEEAWGTRARPDAPQPAEPPAVPRARTGAQSREPPTVTVRIGAIEIRPEPQPPAPAPAAPPRPAGFAEYLLLRSYLRPERYTP